MVKIWYCILTKSVKTVEIISYQFEFILCQIIQYLQNYLSVWANIWDFGLLCQNQSTYNKDGGVNILLFWGWFDTKWLLYMI